MTTKAYRDGLVDGEAWNLGDFDTLRDAAAQATGWDEATIDAVGSAHCAEAWGVPDEGPQWEAACSDYNRGVVASIHRRMTEDTYTYTIYDSDPSTSSGPAWPDHEDVELEADSDEAAIAAVRAVMATEHMGSVGDRIYAIVWNADQMIVGQPTYLVEEE